MRKLSFLGLLLVANFATANMGLPLGGEGGKFSISNIAPLLFIASALPLYMAQRKTVDRRIIWFFLVFNATSLLSFGIFLIRFRWEPNFLVLSFQNAAILFCLLLAWYGEWEPEDFYRAVRAGIYCSLLSIALWGWHDFVTARFQYSFGMDD